MSIINKNQFMPQKHQQLNTQVSNSLCLLNNLLKDKQAYVQQIKNAKMQKNMMKVQQNFIGYINTHKQKPFRILAANRIGIVLNRIVLKEKNEFGKKIRQKVHQNKVNNGQKQKRQKYEGSSIRFRHFMLIMKKYEGQTNLKNVKYCLMKLKQNCEIGRQKQQQNIRIQSQLQNKVIASCKQKIMDRSDLFADTNMIEILMNRSIEESKYSVHKDHINQVSITKEFLLSKISELQCNFRQIASKYLLIRQNLEQQAKSSKTSFSQSSQILYHENIANISQQSSKHGPTINLLTDSSLGLNLHFQQIYNSVEQLSDRNQELHEEMDNIRAEIQGLLIQYGPQIAVNTELTGILLQIKQLTRTNPLGLSF